MTPFPGYHAHIYYEPETRQSAAALQAKLGKDFAGKLRHWGKLIDRPIGPHPKPMFEIDFEAQYFSEIVNHLMQSHGVHSVLIHPETGHDLTDHTQHALWLGKQLPLKLEIFTT